MKCIIHMLPSWYTASFIKCMCIKWSTLWLARDRVKIVMSRECDTLYVHPKEQHGFSCFWLTRSLQATTFIAYETRILYAWSPAYPWICSGCKSHSLWGRWSVLILREYLAAVIIYCTTLCVHVHTCWVWFQLHSLFSEYLLSGACLLTNYS